MFNFERIAFSSLIFIAAFQWRYLEILNVVLPNVLAFHGKFHEDLIIVRVGLQNVNGQTYTLQKYTPTDRRNVGRPRKECRDQHPWRRSKPGIACTVLRERKNQQDATIRCLLLTSVSTCFGNHYAHLQEIKDLVTAFGVLLWFCWMWLVAVVGRCVVGC